MSRRAREWLTIILTALAGPVGSVAIGRGLGAWAEATTGGMAVLAAVVVGVWLGAPVLALMAFGICQLTLLRGESMRRWRALLVMLAAAIVEAIAALVGLRLVGGSASPELILLVVAVVGVGVLGAGAYLAITVSRRGCTADAAD